MDSTQLLHSIDSRLQALEGRLEERCLGRAERIDRLERAMLKVTDKIVDIEKKRNNPVYYIGAIVLVAQAAQYLMK